MLLSTLLLVAAAAPAPLPVAPAALPAPAQDEKPPADERPEVAELLSRFSAHTAKRGKEDKEAVEVIDKLVVEFPASGPKDRAAIVKALDRAFGEKRQEDEMGRQNSLFLASAEALGHMAPESVKVLIAWIGHKSHRKDIALQRLLILKLGGTRSPDGIKPLGKLLDDKEAQIQSAAAQALGEFDGADLKVRKEIFEDLLKLLMTVKGQVDSDPNDIISRERYDIIAAPITTSLSRLSKHQESDPQEWLRWWNKNKKENWDAQG